MIVLDLELKGIYGFNDFHINFSYPKKIVNSIIDQEYLKGRERFRYKKAVILMGANATGKTSLGKALLRIFGYMTDGNPRFVYKPSSPISLSVRIWDAPISMDLLCISVWRV